MTTQLRALYTNPSELSNQALLEQISELAEIGFDIELEHFIKSNKAKIDLYTDSQFKASEHSEEYLNFLNDLIKRLSSAAQKKINTMIIRQKRDDILFLSRQGGSKDKFEKIGSIEDSHLAKNVIERLRVFQQMLMIIRKARSIVTSASDNVVASQNSLELKQDLYAQFISDPEYSLKSLAEFEKNLQLWFADNFSSASVQLDEKNSAMAKIIKKCEEGLLENDIRMEQSELDKQRINFEQIKKQAVYLMSLITLLKQIKTIEATIAEKTEQMLTSSDAYKLQELIQFITEKEKEIELLKQQANSVVKIPAPTLLAIGSIEQSIQVKKKQAEAALNQLQANSLVKSVKDDLAAKQEQMDLMQEQYAELIAQSNNSLEPFAKFDENLELWFGDNSSSIIKSSFDEKIRLMNELVKQYEENPIGEDISKELNELKDLISKFELIIVQAQSLKSLRILLGSIKNIEEAVNKEEGLLVPENADNLRAFTQFIAKKKEELQQIKEKIVVNTLMSQKTLKAIMKIEESLQRKMEKAEGLLQQIKTNSSEAPIVEKYSDKDSRAENEHQEAPVVSVQPMSPPTHEVHRQEEATPPDQGSNKGKEQAALAEEKRKRLQEAISLLDTYENILKAEGEGCFKPLFYHSRNQAKIGYCYLLRTELKSQVNNINFESDLPTIINNAHQKALPTSRARDEITKGGSYFGTSRMLSVQRLLGITEAWEKKGVSKFLGSDFHGLKASGVCGEAAFKTVNDFYTKVENSDEQFHELKEKAFPTDSHIQKKNEY